MTIEMKLKSYRFEEHARKYADQQRNMIIRKRLTKKCEITMVYVTGEQLPWQVIATISE